MASKAWRWVVDRFGFGPIWDKLLDRQVPKDPWYHGDGMALLVLLTMLVVTGVVLALGYCPSLDEAHASVEYITTQQTLGWFVRGLHYWSGGLMVVVMFLHLCRQIMLGGYKAPREGTWLVGVVLLFAVLTTSLLGYILRWDERGLSGLRVALAAFGQVPAIGEDIVLLVQGGPEISSLTLTRVFALHVILLPLLILAAVSYHVYLVVLHGTTTTDERKQPVETAEEQREIYQEQAEHPVRGEVFFPTAVIKISPWSIIALSLAVTLTLTVGPQELLAPANLSSASHAKEEWWFAWYSALIALLPPKAAPAFQVLFPIALLLLLVLLPFVDQSPHRGWRKRPLAVVIVVALVLAILGLSGLRYASPWTGELGREPPAIPEGVVLTATAEEGRQLFPKYGCTNCHAVSRSTPVRIGPDLARLDRLLSQSELRQYILHPPAEVAMPAYAGHLPDADLERLVAFVLVAQTFPRTLEQGP